VAERKAIERVLAFANIARVISSNAVYAQLGVVDSGLYLRVGQTEFIPLQSRLREPDPRGAELLERDRAHCERLLAQLAVDIGRARTRDADAVGQLLRGEFQHTGDPPPQPHAPPVGAYLLGEPRLDADGMLSMNLRSISGVQAAYAYALGLLLDPAREWGSRLRRCPLQTCRIFFLTKERGRPSRFCCPEHQREYDDAMSIERKRRKRAKTARSHASSNRTGTASRK
jgi:hypothetical protein